MTQSTAPPRALSIVVANTTTTLTMGAGADSFPPSAPATPLQRSGDMKATQTLKHEHDVIRQGAGDPRRPRGADRGQRPPAGEDLAGLLEFFTVFADGCHHVKEERILFPALEAAGLARERGSVGMLLDQHVRSGPAPGGRAAARSLPGVDASRRRGNASPPPRTSTSRCWSSTSRWRTRACCDRRRHADRRRGPRDRRGVRAARRVAGDGPGRPPAPSPDAGRSRRAVPLTVTWDAHH